MHFAKPYKLSNVLKIFLFCVINVAMTEALVFEVTQALSSTQIKLQ